MVFYLSPKDVFLTVGRYGTRTQTALVDPFHEGGLQSITLLTLPSHPISVSLEIPSAATTIEALGYHHIAALGDAIVSPHNWQIAFPLYVNTATKNFLSLINEIFHSEEPIFLAVLMRTVDASTNVHFISPISLINSIQYRFDGDESRINLTLQSPYTSVGTLSSPYVQVAPLYPIHDPKLTLRLATLSLQGWERTKHSHLGVDEIISLNFATNRQINWHHTTLSPSHSFAALRAAMKFSTGHINISGSFTVGFPQKYNDLQTRPLKNAYDLTLNFNHELLRLKLNIYGLKPLSWTQTITPTNVPSLTINWVALDHEWI